MIDWMILNKEITAGIIAAIAAILAAIISLRGKDNDRRTNNSNSIVNNNTVVIPQTTALTPVAPCSQRPLDKDTARILFVDDDTSFQVVKILRNANWKNVKAVKDINSLDAQNVTETHMFFIDIQGVGKALSFKDEGLGLALAIKRKYPEKKVVIYSSEPQGDRFHQAFREADDFLSKNAEPYEFQQIVDNLIKQEVGQ